MKHQVFLLCLITAVFARPEAGYGSTSVPGNPIDYNPPVNPINPFNPLTDCLADGPCFNQPSTNYLPGGNNNFNQNEYNHNSYQDQKNVYFFAAPDDEQTARLRVYVEPSSRRNTKVIFIKAPGHGGTVPEIIAPPSQAVDKTLVYVLSKKQHDGGSVTIPANLGIKQAKPEVYFVKYRNQHDAEGAVYQGLNGQRVGTGLDDLGNAQVFTSRLYDHRGFVNNGFNTGISVHGGGIGTNYGPPTASGPYYK